MALRCDPEFVHTFKAKRMDGVDFRPNSHGEGRVHGVPAPGRIVMMVREGPGWVLLHDGTRENLTATSVVIWEPGDWVEYGSNAGEGLKTESYREKDLSEAEWKAMSAEVFWA